MTSLIRDVIADPVPSPEILLRLASNIALQFRRQFVNRSTISFGDGGEQLGIVFPANVVHHLFDGIDDHCLLALEATLGHFSGEVFLDVPRQVDGRTMVVSLPGYVNVPDPRSIRGTLPSEPPRAFLVRYAMQLLGSASPAMQLLRCSTGNPEGLEGPHPLDPYGIISWRMRPIASHQHDAGKGQ
jgi:hypothetical protein